MFLAIDIGNTRTKVAVYEKDKAVQHFIFPIEDLASELSKLISKQAGRISFSLSNVGRLNDELVQWLKENGHLTLINASSPTPFRNHYTTPKTLGADRVVLAAGATLKYPEQNRLVIDAGTCITYDFISSEDVYYGGAIAPGLQLRFKSLNDYTSRLPLLQISYGYSLIGDSTESSILSGVINGVLYEINGFIASYKEQFGTLTVILTGGDSIFLAERLKNSIFAQPNFLTESLFLHHQYIYK